MDKLADSLIELACARHAYETNRTFVLAVGGGTRENPTPLPVPWEQAGEELQDAMVEMAHRILTADLTAEEKHDLWVAKMRREGRDHAMLRPYAELPYTQRAKDELVVASVNAMAMALGHSCRPLETRTLRFDREAETKPDIKV